MPTLHSNNQVPSNGSVATVIRGVKSISMTLSGVGAVRAVVQIMAHEDGAAPGPIGNQIVVSGTTTVTTTQTFNAEAGQVYLQLVDITPACKFSATLTELGPIQDTNPGSPFAPFASTTERDAWAAANLSILYLGYIAHWTDVAGQPPVRGQWIGPGAGVWGGASFGGSVSAESFAPVARTVSSVNGRYAEADDLGCVALWDFDEDDGDNFISKAGHPYELRNGVGSTVMVDTADGPVSGRSVVFDGSTDYLRLEAGKIGSLCISAFGNNVTVISIAKKTALNTTGFIAGVWQEDDNNPRRQYGLFLSLPVYGGGNKVCGHVSKTGGASPGLPYSRDYSVNREQFLAGSWGCFAMSYDGAHARSYMYSRFESVPTYTEPGLPAGAGLTYAKNPYAFPLGLNNTNVGNFTVGAVKLTSGYSNHFAGKVAAIAVFKRALSQAEITKVCAMLLRGKDTAPLIWYPFRWQDGATGGMMSGVSVNKTYALSVCTDWTANADNGGGFRVTKLSDPDSFLFVTEGTQPAFWFDEQAFGMPFSSIRKMTVLMNHYQPPTTLLYFCARVNGTWWALGSGVSCASEHTSGTDWSGAETGIFTMAASAAATRIDFRPGVALGLTSDVRTVADIDDGAVDSIGLYNPTRVGLVGHPLRIRDLKVYA